MVSEIRKVKECQKSWLREAMPMPRYPDKLVFVGEEVFMLFSTYNPATDPSTHPHPNTHPLTGRARIRWGGDVFSHVKVFSYLLSPVFSLSPHL